MTGATAAIVYILGGQLLREIAYASPHDVVCSTLWASTGADSFAGVHSLHYIYAHFDCLTMVAIAA